jgi:hypothetical protein
MVVIKKNIDVNLTIIYNKICERGQFRILNDLVYTEKHHIIPKSMGGTNKKDNLTNLTAKEHFICHKILCELYPNNEKLKYAFWAMCNQRKNRDYIVSSRDYEYAKNLCLEIWKKPKTIESIRKGVETKKRNKFLRDLKGEKINRKQNGALNHNHNKKWVTNILTNESKMILGDIPKGWKLGRARVGMLGKPNVLGKKWYHSIENNEEKYFNPTDTIPENYIKGRLKNKK